MRRLVLATGNAGKVREFNELLRDFQLEVMPQSAFAVPEAEETGLSFVENALLKARNASRHTGLPAMADDSGLEVDALQGAPGIRSARYAGEGADDRANLERLLAALENVPDPRRGARFQCVIVYLRHAEDPTPLICQGTWEGTIARAPRGENGFGYDPVFLVAGRDRTAAELSSREKNAMSHRGQALAKLVEALKARAVAPAPPAQELPESDQGRG